MAEKSPTVVAPPPSLRGSKDSENDTGTQGVNTPDIDPKTGKVRRAAISSAEQAHRLCDQMFNPSSERNRMNATIAKKYADSPPYESKSIEDWRHNFPTGFLSGIINRIVPTPVAAIDQAKYLTSARLDEKDDPDGNKSDSFQRETTKLFRSWSSWRTLCYAIAQEDITFGYAAAVCTDPDDWRPKFYRQDEFGVPDGTGQHADDIQFFGLRQSFLINEMVELIEDQKAADLGGWNVDNTIQAINEAMPKSRQANANQLREHVDLVREGNAGLAHDAEAKVIETYHLCAQEPQKGISHWVTRKAGDPKLLFDNPDEFDKMRDRVTLFTFEPGNSKFYGSKGIGRKLTPMHIAIERARMKMCDHAYLSGMIWVKSDGGLPTVHFKVQHPIGIIGTDADLDPTAMPISIEGYKFIDERITAYAEQAVGQYFVDKLDEGTGSKDPTATETVIRDKRAQQQSANFLARFFGQFSEMVSMMTRIACNPKTRDKEAKEYQRTLKEDCNLTDEEIKKLAEMQAIEVINDVGQQQALIQLIQGLLASNSPFFNQKLLAQKLVTLQGNAALAEEVMLKDEFDPKDEAKQFRLQTLETAAIRSGESVNVAPDDIHPIHLKNLLPDMQRAMPKIAEQFKTGAPRDMIGQLMDNMHTSMMHGLAHCDMWEEKAKASKNEDDLAAVQKYRDALEAIDHQLIALAQEIKTTPPPLPPEAMAQQPPPGAAPPVDPNAPPVGPNGLSEKVLVAWIGQYPNLRDDEKRNLEKIGGIGLPQDDLAAAGPPPIQIPAGTSGAPVIPQNGSVPPIQIPGNIPLTPTPPVVTSPTEPIAQ